MAEELISVRKQALSGAGDQDYTVAGFGTPDGAIVFAQRGGDGADAAHMMYSVGFWDGTNQVCTFVAIEDNNTVSTGIANGSAFNNRVVELNLANLAESRNATISNTTNGVTLTWDSSTDFQPWCTVILIKGTTGVVAGTFQPDAVITNTVSPSTTGINPNFVIMAESYTSALNYTSETIAAMSLGFASDESGGITNRCAAFGHQDSGGQGANASDLRGTSLVTAAIRFETSVTAFGTAEFTVTTDTVQTAANGHVAFLAMQVDVPPVLFLTSTPTSGDFDPYTDTKQPQSVLMATSHVTTKNVVNGADPDCSGLGWYFASVEGDESGGYATSDETGTTTDTNGRTDVALIIQNEGSGTPDFDASLPTFDGGGILFSSGNINHDNEPLFVVGAAFGVSVTITSVSSDDVIGAAETDWVIAGSGFGAN